MNLYEWCVIEYLKYRKLHHYRIEDLKQFMDRKTDESIKNFDILVPGTDENVLIEVKGRKASGKNKLRFENWVTGEDIQSLMHWKKMFGKDFMSIFCFVYKIDHDMPAANSAFTCFSANNMRFAIFGIELNKYIAESSLRSIKWNTFSLNAKA
ncbi:MAG: HYExAFE family protein, partial [Planctomycetes bacterium]|nr:HYExAFE family protein [Planctomycetota bacterium]